MSDDKVMCDVEACSVAYARGRFRVRRGYRFIVAYKDGEEGESEITATCLDRVCQHGLVDKYNAAHPPESTLLMVTRSRSQSRGRSADPNAPAATVVDPNLEVSVEVPEMAGLKVGSKADNPSANKMDRGSLKKLADDLLVQHGFVQPGKVENQAAVTRAVENPEADLRKVKAPKDEKEDVSINSCQSFELLNKDEARRKDKKEQRRAEKKEKRQAKNKQKNIDGKVKEMLTAMGYSEEVIDDIFTEIKNKKFELVEDKIRAVLDKAQEKTKAAVARFQEQLSTQETQSSASSSVSSVSSVLPDNFEMPVGEDTDEDIKQTLAKMNFVMTEKVTMDGAVYMKMVEMGGTMKILVELDTAVEYFDKQFYHFLRPLGLQSP